MRGPLTGVLAVALVAWGATHVALLVGLARSRPWRRTLLALALPPIVPLWGFEAGMRARARLWCVALAVYAVGVALARR